ncbi:MULTISPECIES: RsmB/NOP family class I SAM-dependent RNA methyltransferase [unclassified Sphingomonas]|uniref:RsmB/NOP family class I SAM-dependent RNA methyltransferase n=1 Tax=unclassified Sphingomonas TaxID=196159 RepID=UPI0006F24422|nr:MULTISPECIES: transcription antitermination factor NusB [unclassified Sphingomonas]KQM57937.1 SAM-dependent methyltransferase [Sphingomonas sp. Leaf16]KQN12777.1 SAM-dependent methyltransferase [Sphingomonas sp. Leaf29]KQN19665.1 SAM-dependent methyltransferase [Sphingomonas sp. Leaf32]
MARPRLAPEAPGVPARRAALKLLDAVIRRGLPLEAALASATAELDRREDRGLAHAIAAAVLRRLPDLDALIDGATQRPLPDDAKARFVLRLALAQALVLNTPPHAAIATALPLVDGGPRKLVHGVFGTLMRGNARLPDAATLPADTDARWVAAWGEDMVIAAAQAIAQQPPVDLSLKGEDGPEGLTLAPRHRRLAEHGAIADLPGYAGGEWWVQDLAASIPARLLGKGPGHALDLCAAPGGKTLQLAAAGWDVTALDNSASRLMRLTENLERTGLSAKVVTGDALVWKPAEPVDAILLDAPCSATGIFRRHPDVLHRVRPSVIAETAALQARLLARAADWVKPGGRLVYATCSLEPAEGEAQLDRFLSGRPDYAVEPATAEELPEGVSANPGGYVRTLPGMLADQGGLDGFFIVRLRRS